MSRKPNLFGLSLRTGMMMAQANMVIGMRLMGMAGSWNVTSAENKRMVDEKTEAAVASGTAMMKAALSGKGPVAVAEAGLAPVARKTRANAKRLAKRGPKVGT
ncbi:MAG: hypothetical protein RLZZ437_896 [Pseudomonadota bacterium]|jgi:hypothetical protein